MSIISSFGITPQMPEWHLYNNGVLDPEWAVRPENERDFFIFSSIRNPFDRIVSAWKYLAATKERPLEDVLASPPRDGHDYRHFTRPQADILRDTVTGRLVTHDLIRFESLQSDYDRICGRLGKPTVPLGHVNPTERDRNWRQYFTPTARRMAEAMFAEDLALFDYSF